MHLIGKMVGAPWDGGPLTINPIYTLYSACLLGPNPLLKGSKGFPTIFPIGYTS